MTDATTPQQWEVRYYDPDARRQDVAGPFPSYEDALSDARDRRKAGYAAWVEHYSPFAKAGAAPSRSNVPRSRRSA